MAEGGSNGYGRDPQGSKWLTAVREAMQEASIH